MSNLMPLNDLNPIEVFQDGGLDKLLNDIRQEATSVIQDVTTEKGRKNIASMAYKVARSKTAIDDVGKSLVAEWKAKSKVVDSERKRARDECDAIRDEVRKPLDEWEQAEQQRIDKHTNLINLLSAYGEAASNWMDRSLESLRADMDALKSKDGRVFDEFEERAKEVISASISKVADAIDKKRTYETEQAELTKLREEAAEREAKEATERAEKARKEREEQIRKEAAEKEKRAAQEREEALQREKERAEKAKLQAEAEAKAAEERAEKAEEDARKRAEEEQERIAAQKVQEQERLERNKQHKGKIHREIASCLENAVNLSPETCKKIVTAIAKKQISHVKIEY